MPRIYVTPPKPAQAIARAAMKLRATLPESRRGGLSTSEAHSMGVGSGVKRAQDIAAGKRVDAAQIHAFFSRFKGQIARALAKGLTPANSRALMAADLWGGFPMWHAAKEALGI